MRLDIPSRPLPEKEVCFKEKRQEVDKYIFTISSFKRVKYGTFEKNKRKTTTTTTTKKCKDICIVTAPACQGNQLPQYCQPSLEFPKQKRKKEKEKKQQTCLTSWFAVCFIISLSTSTCTTQLKHMEKLLFKQATQNTQKLTHHT